MSESTATGDAPALAILQLVPELERLHKERHRTLRTCVYGRLTDSPAPDAEITARIGTEPVRFAVRQVSSELELRLSLVENPRDDVVYVIPFARRLPRDLAARFAKGEVHLPRIEQQVPKRFGARRASPRLLNSALLRLARLEGAREYVSGARETETVDLDEAWLLHLQSHLGVTAGQLTVARFFEEVLSDGAGRGLTYSKLLANVADARTELRGVLDRRFGKSGPAILEAWLAGRQDLLGAAALVGEGSRAALQATTGAARTGLLLSLEASIKSVPGHPLRTVLDEQKRDGLGQLLLELADQVALVWPTLRQARSADAAALVRLAEQLLVTDEARDAAVDSHRLPYTFDLRLVRLSKALKSVATGQSSFSQDQLRALSQAVVRHERSESISGLEQVVDMAIRLAAFARAPQPPVAQAATEEVSGLTAWQVTDGGYLDWARHELRGHDAGALKEGVLFVLAAADAARDRLNERFAHAYVRLVEHKGARKNLAGASPIELALGRFGLDHLATAKDLRFLVICMDGMSWANLVELCAPATSKLRTFAPLTAAGQAEGDRPAPVLAQVPTITRLSRTALFLGRELALGEPLDTTRDPDRLARHPIAAGLERAPTLWLKRDLVAPAGKLNDDVRKLVDDPQASVVGVVVNAIDDQLKGSSQLRVRLTVDAIPVLDSLLEAAERSGRLVLICSDHGNVSSGRFSSAPAVASKGPEGGARWRWLVAGESPRPEEVVVPSGALPVPPGAIQLAVPFDEVTRYTAMTHAGEHGGLTLSEAVAPFVLLSPPGLVGELVDERKLFKRASLDAPGWWSGEVAPQAPTPAAVVKRTPQATLFPEEDRPAAIVGSELFKLRARNRRKEDVERVRKGLAALIRAGGRAGREAFGREVGVQIASRVPGYVATMAEFLNVDQEVVVGMDARQTQVELDVVLLEKLFLGGNS